MISLNARLKIPIVDQITVVSVFTCQNIIIETLFPVDIINGILYLLLLRQQRTTFLFKDAFSFWNCCFTLKADGKVFVHFINTHTTVF